MPPTTIPRRRRRLGLHRYEPVLRARRARWPIAGNMLALVGEAGCGLAILLAVRGAYGSFGTAGTVVGLSAIAVAATRVVQGRLMDRFGLRAVLVPLAWLQLLAFAGIALAISAHVPVALLLALGMLSGALLPAVPAAMRTLWTVLLPDPDERAVAYAFDATTGELALMGAPALAGGLLVAASPAGALLTMGAFTAVGTLLLAGSGAARAHAPRERVAPAAAPTALGRMLAGPAAITFALAVALGTVDVAAAAFATAHRTPGATGLLLGLWAAGSLVGGLCFGALRRRRSSERRLLACLMALTLTFVPLAFASSVLALGLLLVVAGLPMAPSLTTLFVLADERAPRGRATEAFGWVGSALQGGAACGAALAGWVVAGFGVPASFAAAAVLGGLAVALAALGARGRPRAAPAGA